MELVRSMDLTRVLFCSFCFVSVLCFASGLSMKFPTSSSRSTYGQDYWSITKKPIVNKKWIDDDDDRIDNGNNNGVRKDYVGGLQDISTGTSSSTSRSSYNHPAAIFGYVVACVLVLYLMFIGVCTLILRLRHRGTDDPVYPILKAAVFNYANMFELLYYVPVNVEETVDADRPPLVSAIEENGRQLPLFDNADAVNRAADGLRERARDRLKEGIRQFKEDKNEPTNARKRSNTI